MGNGWAGWGLACWESRVRGSVGVQEQPAGGVPGDDGVEVPDELAPDPDLRATRHEIRAVSSGIRDALAADDLLAAGDQADRTAQ